MEQYISIIATICSTIIGGIIAIVSTSFTTRMNSKKEKKKDKIQTLKEIYKLINDLFNIIERELKVKKNNDLESNNVEVIKEVIQKKSEVEVLAFFYSRSMALKAGLFTNLCEQYVEGNIRDLSGYMERMKNGRAIVLDIVAKEAREPFKRI